MMAPKKNIRDIPDELIHNTTTHRKRLISHDETHKGDIATMNHAWLEPGKQLELHTHPDGEEFYFFLEGTGQILVGTEWLPVEPGDFVTIPVSFTHSLKNTGGINLIFLTIRTLDRIPPRV